MYDLEVLRYLNEQAHFRAVQLANEGLALSVPASEAPKQVSPPLVFPLSILAKKLIGGPPSLAYFIELLEMGETFTGFRDLVREYLPEYEANIMAEDLDDRARKFSQLFSESFFPLAEDREDFTIGDLLSGIPTQPLGFSYESYHMFTDFRSGYILALSLVECPWDEDPLGPREDDDEEEGEMAGARIPILEMVGELVGEYLAHVIPDNGWPAEVLHRMTDGTEFEGLGDFADWVCGDTGLYHLDAHGESRETGQQMDWSRDTVDDLTEDWHKSCEVFENIHRLALLLEQDSIYTFRKLLALLLDNPNLVVPKEQLPLPLG